jgi:multiple sugar transport system ATP-binding protein
MRVELARLRDRLKATTLYVTHDQVEAITLGDRVAVFRDGRLQQFDTPRALFESPANIFVGAFIGSPAMNLVEAFIDDGFARFGGFAIPIPPGCDLTAYRQTSVILGIRPTDLSVAGGDARGRDGVLEVTADVVEDLGTAMHVVFSVEATAARIAGVTAEASSSETERSNTQALLTAEIDPDWSIGAGSPLALAVTGAVHFFDRDSGAAIASGETRPGEREQPTSSIQQGGTVR